VIAVVQWDSRWLVIRCHGRACGGWAARPRRPGRWGAIRVRGDGSLPRLRPAGLGVAITGVAGIQWDSRCRRVIRRHHRAPRGDGSPVFARSGRMVGGGTPGRRRPVRTPLTHHVLRPHGGEGHPRSRRRRRPLHDPPVQLLHDTAHRLLAGQISDRVRQPFDLLAQLRWDGQQCSRREPRTLHLLLDSTTSRRGAWPGREGGWPAPGRWSKSPRSCASRICRSTHDSTPTPGGLRSVTVRVPALDPCPQGTAGRACPRPLNSPGGPLPRSRRSACGRSGPARPARRWARRSSAGCRCRGQRGGSSWPGCHRRSGRPASVPSRPR
jgi:hypothetical protein